MICSLTLMIGAGASGLIIGWAARDLREHRWDYSTRMKNGIHPVPVRQTRETPPDEHYQEYHHGRWRDIPLDERGDWYKKHYVKL